ncbi:MAG: DUF4189 domain-containing protein [Acetobacteraceae bacterium]|nr:DUF4189 domain-containing protein [Acetobacteraceae bacterium]
MAWNRAGLWVARSGPALNQVSLNALEECNRSFGNCEIAPVSLSPGRRSCLAIARNSYSHLDIAPAPTEGEAERSALEKCRAAKAGDCQISYSVCN